MAKPKQEEQQEEQTVKFVDELPPKGRYNPWAERLQLLVMHPRRWAEVWIADSAYQARDAVSNLNRRKIDIPRSDHEWNFASRGNLVFAMYGGPGKKARRKNA